MSASPLFPKLPIGWSEESLWIQDRKIHIRLYRSANLSQGRLLFVVHGQAEQSDRYAHFPHYLNGLVDAVACVDLPGHGLSQGVRGHIENFDQYSDAALGGFQTSLDWMKKNAGQVKAHWLGHSLGGLITLRTLLKETNLPLSSVTVSSPLLGLAFPVPKVKKFFAELIEPVLGSLKLHNELNAEDLSHDPSVGDYFIKNPLNHHFVTPRFFVNMVKEVEATAKNSGPMAYNFLMISALADPIVSWKAGFEFFANLQMAAGKKKELVSFPYFRHESFNELEKGRAFNAFSDWLMKNSGK